MYQHNVQIKREKLVKTIMHNTKYLSKVSSENFRELEHTKEVLEFTQNQNEKLKTQHEALTAERNSLIKNASEL